MSTADSDFNISVIEEFRAHHGRVGGMFEKSPLLLLHHVGARSGRSRVTPLGYHYDDGRYVVVASNGGSPVHPDWYHNLKTHLTATIEVGADTIDVIAHEATAHERQRLFDAIAVDAEQLIEYQARTDRLIPVITLVPTDPVA